MTIQNLEIPDVKIFIPEVFRDERGYFFEAFREDVLSEAGIHADFVQDNHSFSMKGVLRGLHFQLPPFEQGKLVRVIRGAVIDVAVDLRKDSPYFGKCVSHLLSSENNIQMWVPPGFAHGFISLEEENYFYYKCTAYYNSESERIIIWNDPDLNINWQNSHPLISERDSRGSRFSELQNLL
jgi:dTDP-4-dehydrorhamnose 3,5-epimerase